MALFDKNLFYAFSDSDGFKPITISNDEITFAESDFGFNVEDMKLGSHITVEIKPITISIERKYFRKRFTRRVIHLAVYGKSRRVRKKNAKRAMGRFERG